MKAIGLFLLLATFAEAGVGTSLECRRDGLVIRNETGCTITYEVRREGSRWTESTLCPGRTDTWEGSGGRWEIRFESRINERGGRKEYVLSRRDHVFRESSCGRFIDLYWLDKE